MASVPEQRSPDVVRREIDAERTQLARSVDALRDEVAKATDVGAKLRANLPAIAAGALGTGFFLAGGIGATARLLARRGREGSERARIGRYSIIDRD
jgi:hypothetical protein